MTPDSKSETEIPPHPIYKGWDSMRLIGRVRDRYKELELKNWDWRSFYNAWLEGRADMLKQMKEDFDKADKPTGLPWIEIKPGCEMPNYDEFVLWRREDGIFAVLEIDKDDEDWWNKDRGWGKLTHWARITGPDESTPDETATLCAQLTAAQAEIDLVTGEAKAYREALEYIKSELSKKDVTDGGKTIYHPGDSIKMWNIIIIILDKYQPTQKIQYERN